MCKIGIANQKEYNNSVEKAVKSNTLLYYSLCNNMLLRVLGKTELVHFNQFPIKSCIFLSNKWEKKQVEKEEEEVEVKNMLFDSLIHLNAVGGLDAWFDLW